MDIFYKYLSLYGINDATLNSNLVSLNKKKRYVIATFKNNNLIDISINYKFVKFMNTTKCYRFSYNDYCYDYDINNNENKTNILELTDDFSNEHLTDLLFSHYNNGYIINTDDMGINMRRCEIFKCVKNKRLYSKNTCKEKSNNGFAL